MSWIILILWWYQYHGDNQLYFWETEYEPSKHFATKIDPDILVYRYNLDPDIRKLTKTELDNEWNIAFLQNGLSVTMRNRQEVKSFHSCILLCGWYNGHWRGTNI